MALKIFVVLPGFVITMSAAAFFKSSIRRILESEAFNLKKYMVYSENSLLNAIAEGLRIELFDLTYKNYKLKLTLKRTHALTQALIIFTPSAIAFNKEFSEYTIYFFRLKASDSKILLMDDLKNAAADIVITNPGKTTKIFKAIPAKYKFYIN
ncbi:unnamed protein product [Meloidogyne enterolobii]|uniref:Uncharacterized protein n=1 Tax=Meloidogyne enterolobii TaxID=390850 RepID=A0ACB0XM42_MELEN